MALIFLKVNLITTRKTKIEGKVYESGEIVKSQEMSLKDLTNYFKRISNHLNRPQETMYALADPKKDGYGLNDDGELVKGGQNNYQGGYILKPIK